jgi:competence protein ComEC
MRTSKEWFYGDRIMLKGEIKVPAISDGFSYRDYLSRQGVYSMMEFPAARLVEAGAGNYFYTRLYSFRFKAYAAIKVLFPPDEAALLSGILLGLDMDIPDSLTKAFQDTGTSHIIAISGFNISIIAALAAMLSARLIRNRWRAFLATLVMVTAYTLLAGATPSVVRAAIMGVMTLFGRLIGRRNSGANSLFFTAAAMSVFNPSLPWDASFQLSFGAMLGLVLFAEPLETWFTNAIANRFPDTAQLIAIPVSDYLLVTLAAQITTLPILVYHFQRLSLLTFISNPLALPPQPALMVLGGIATLAGMAFLPIGQALAYLALPTLLYTNRLVELLARLPGGTLYIGEIPAWLVLVYFLILTGLYVFRAQVIRLRKVIPYGFAALALSLGVILTWLWAANAPDGKLHIRILNVDDGPALLIQTPDGQNVLVNGSSSSRALGEQLDRYISPFRRRLDALYLVNPKPSSFSGIQEILLRYPPGMTLWATDPSGIKSSTSLQNYLHGKLVAEEYISDGQTLDLGKGAVLATISTAGNGPIFEVTWKSFRLVWDGRSAADSELPPGFNPTGITALVLPSTNPGSGAAETWVGYRPEVILANHPGETLSTGINVVDFSLSDRVNISTDGDQAWFNSGH